MDSGNPFGPEQKSARGPSSFLPEPLPSFSLLSHCPAGPACHPPPLANSSPLSLEPVTAGVTPPLTPRAVTGHQDPAYKYPSASAPFSLCFPSSSSPGHREIARRSTANLQRSPVDSGLASEPRASSSPLSPPPLSGAP
jgi:hypothetical protein